jgi:hypothetical protein
MLGTWLALLTLVAVIWAWLDALASRERAIRFGRDLCQEAGVQLLDQSVSLKRLRMKRVDGLPAFSRRYGFEVSLDGSDRHRGHLDLAGARLESWSLPLRDGAVGMPKPNHLRLVQ